MLNKSIIELLKKEIEQFRQDPMIHMAIYGSFLYFCIGVWLLAPILTSLEARTIMGVIACFLGAILFIAGQVRYHEFVHHKKKETEEEHETIL